MSEVFKISRGEASLEMRFCDFVKEFNIDELDFVEFVMTVEEAFDCEIPDDVSWMAAPGCYTTRDIAVYLASCAGKAKSKAKPVSPKQPNASVKRPLQSITPAEKWVLRQIAAGNSANLAMRFSDEVDRVLRASFIEDLLTDSLKNAKVHRHGVRIEHAVLVDPIDLENAEIPFETHLLRCIFKEHVNLSHSLFRKSLVLSGSEFHKPANFAFCHIAGNFVANNAQFKMSEEIATRDDDRSLSRRPPSARGRPISRRPPSSRGGKIIPQKPSTPVVGFSGANASPAISKFDDMQVGGGAFFRRAVFEMPVNFRYAKIGGNFEADGAQFNKSARFNSMQVGGSTFLRREHKSVEFADRVDFGHVKIGGNFEAHGALFKNTSEVANFNSMKVSGGAFFRKAIFAGPANFAFADIGGNFEAEGVQFNNTQKAANLNSMKVADSAIFRDMMINGEVSMMDARFYSVLFSVESLPEDAEFMRFDGMTYQHINAEDNNGRASSEKLLELARRAVYSVSVYRNLEAFFQRQGNPELADKIFVDQKQRERKEVLQGIAWWWSLLLDVLVRHGRSPSRGFLWSALFICIGAFVFWRRNGMEPQKPEDTSRKYNAAWYSLDLFLPFIDLQAASVWIPRNDRWIARNYMRVHTLLGWILIPIGLAALTGIIE
jgi:acyl carrier protein